MRSSRFENGRNSDRRPGPSPIAGLASSSDVEPGGMAMASAAVQSQRPRAGWRATTAGELAAECLGTFILICFGDGGAGRGVAGLSQSGRGTQISGAGGDGVISGGVWGLAAASAV